MTENLKKTPLYDEYKERGLKMTDFGGWELPVQYTKLQDEHKAVRERVGIFDVSHMGEIFIRGENATNWVDHIVSNKISNVEVNQAQYNTILNDEGGVKDDLIWFKLAEDEYLVTPNAANTEKIYNWFVDHNQDNQVEIDNQTDNWGLIALQGPKSEQVLAKITDADLPNITSYHFSQNERIADTDGNIIARTGYTGEDGFELYMKSENVEPVWKALLEAGEEFDILECGLGARDSLRLEAGLGLYGNDLKEEWTPLESGVAFAVKVDKEASFPGKERIQEIKSQGNGKSEYMQRGFELIDKGIARQGDKVLNLDGEEIGEVTSGTKSPTMGYALGYAHVKRDEAPLDQEAVFQVRKKQLKGKFVKKNWLRR